MRRVDLGGEDQRRPLVEPGHEGGDPHRATPVPRPAYSPRVPSRRAVAPWGRSRPPRASRAGRCGAGPSSPSSKRPPGRLMWPDQGSSVVLGPSQQQHGAVGEADDHGRGPAGPPTGGCGRPASARSSISVVGERAHRPNPYVADRRARWYPGATILLGRYPRRAVSGGVDGQVPRVGRPRTVSGPEGSSTQRRRSATRSGLTGVCLVGAPLGGPAGRPSRGRPWGH